MLFWLLPPKVLPNIFLIPERLGRDYSATGKFLNWNHHPLTSVGKYYITAAVINLCNTGLWSYMSNEQKHSTIFMIGCCSSPPRHFRRKSTMPTAPPRSPPNSIDDRTQPVFEPLHLDYSFVGLHEGFSGKVHFGRYKVHCFIVYQSIPPSAWKSG